MRLSTKHKNQKTVLYADFSGGLNISTPPDMLRLNELQKADNVEYDPRSALLKTRAGLEKLGTPSVGSSITKAFYAYGMRKLFLAVGTKLYAYDFNSSSLDLIGDLAGTRIPAFAEWEDDILIASGSYLQHYDGSILTTVTDSPLCDFVFVKHGRAGITIAGSDYMSFSGIGDYANWNFGGTDADAQQIEIGYKEGGDIVGVRPFFDDLIVFKDNKRTYRLVGWYPDWEVQEITRGHGAVNKEASQIIGSSLVFIDTDGIVALAPTVEYGDFAFKQVGDKIDSYFSMNLDVSGARVFHVPARGQVWCRPNTGNDCYVLHYLNGAWTRFRFDAPITSALSCPYGTIICKGDSFYRMSDFVYDDDGTAIQSMIVFPRKSGAREILLKHVSLLYQGYGQGTLTLTIGHFTKNIAIQYEDDIAYSDTDIVSEDTDPLVESDMVRYTARTNKRLSYIEPKISCSSGRMGIIALTLEVADV